MYIYISHPPEAIFHARSRRCMSHPPGPIFHARYLHSWNSACAEKAGVVNISSRAFVRRVVRYRHPLGCRAIELRKPPQGCVIYSVVYVTREKQFDRHTRPLDLLEACFRFILGLFVTKLLNFPKHRIIWICFLTPKTHFGHMVLKGCETKFGPVFQHGNVKVAIMAMWAETCLSFFSVFVRRLMSTLPKKS